MTKANQKYKAFSARKRGWNRYGEYVSISLQCEIHDFETNEIKIYSKDFFCNPITVTLSMSSGYKRGVNVILWNS